MLYKYRGWDEWTPSILKDSEFWFAHPSSFNDPYDCQIRINRSDINEVLALDYLAKIFPNSKNEKSEFYGKAYSKVGSFKEDLDKVCEFLKERITEFENYFNNKGILSLSRNPANMLMWGHYGDNHKGIAIGLDPESDGFLNDIRFTNPIHYDEEYPYFTARDVVLAGSWEEWDDLSNLIIHTKSSEWAYEQETRVVIEDGGRVFKSPGKISEIVFGAKCEDSIMGEVMKKCDGLEVCFKRAHLSTTSFKISLVNM